MSLLFLRAVVLLSVLVSFASAGSSTASCSMAELLSALQPLRSNADYTACQGDSTAAALCESSACQALMAPLAALTLPTCQVSRKGVVFNTLALRSISSASCSQATQTQNISDTKMLWTILRLLN